MNHLFKDFSINNLKNILKRGKIKINSNDKKILIKEIENNLIKLQIKDLQNILEKNFIDFSGNKKQLVEKIQKIKPSIIDKIKDIKIKLKNNEKWKKRAQIFVGVLMTLIIGSIIFKIGYIDYLYKLSLPLKFLSSKIKNFSKLIYNVILSIKQNNSDNFIKSMNILGKKLGYTKNNIIKITSIIWESGSSTKSIIFKFFIFIFEYSIKVLDEQPISLETMEIKKETEMITEIIEQHDNEISNFQKKRKTIEQQENVSTFNKKIKNQNNEINEISIEDLENEYLNSI